MKLKLRPFESSDKYDLAKLFNNKNILNNLRDRIPFPYTTKDAEEYINLCKSSEPITNFAIDYNSKLVGSIGIELQQDVYKKSAELCYWVAEPFWNKGIATLAVQLIIEYTFSNFDLIRIFSSVFDYNIGSIKVLEKNGFEKEGLFKNAIYKNNRFCDEIRFALLK